MKTFISRVGLFLLLPLGWVMLSILVTRASIERFDAGGLYSYDYAWIDRLPHRPRLVLMGSSTVKYGLSPTLLAERLGLKEGEVINLAETARTPLQSYYVYKAVESRLDSVQTIVYGIDTWVFSERYYRYDGRAVSLWSPGELLYGICRRYVPLKELSGVSFYARLVSRYRPGRVPLSIIPPDLGATALNGRPRNFGEPPEMWFERGVYEMAELQFRYMRKLKDEVERNGAEFVVLLPPKRTDWRDAYRRRCSDVDEEFVNLWVTHVGSTAVLGSYGSLPPDIEDDLFSDGVHLNAKGQACYTLVFAKEFVDRDKDGAATMKHTFLY